MTVSSTVNRAAHTGNGVTTVFPFLFRLLAEEDLLLVVTDDDGNETELVLDTDYTVSGVGAYSGFSVTLAEALTNGYIMVGRRKPEQTQPLDLEDQGPFPPNDIETQLDRQLMMIQAIQDEVDRSLKVGEAVDPDSFSLQFPTPQAGYMLGWNAGETAIINIQPGSIELALPATDSVGTDELQDDAVTTVKIDDEAVTTAKLDDEAVTNDKIADDTITPAKLAGAFGLVDYSDPVLVTGATTLEIGRHHVCSGTAADYTVDLPPGDNIGDAISVEMDDAAALTKLVTLDADGSETINGELTRVMWAGEWAELIWNGTEWKKRAGLTIPMCISLTRTGMPQVVSPGGETVTFNATVIDNGGVECDLNMDSTKVTIRRDGIYDVTIAGQYASGQTVDQLVLVAQKTGSSTGMPNAEMSAPATGFLPSLTASEPVPCAAGDEITMTTDHDSMSDRNFQGVKLAVMERPVW